MKSKSYVRQAVVYHADIVDIIEKNQKHEALKVVEHYRDSKVFPEALSWHQEMKLGYIEAEIPPKFFWDFSKYDARYFYSKVIGNDYNNFRASNAPMIISEWYKRDVEKPILRLRIPIYSLDAAPGSPLSTIIQKCNIRCKLLISELIFEEKS